MLSDFSQSGIAYEADLLDVPVMISHEAEVGRHCSETLPPGKRRGLDDDAGEISRLLNVWVDCFRELGKIALLEGFLEPHIQNGVRGVEGVFDHVLLLAYRCGLTQCD